MMCQLNCNKECDSCGECREVEPKLYDSYGKPIFDGDDYWEIDNSTILSEESLEQFKKRA